MVELRRSGVFSLGSLSGDVEAIDGDDNWNDVVLLMKGDNSLTDETGRHTPTATSAAFSTDTPFASGSTHSMSFNGTSSTEVTIPYSTDFQFGSDVFTVEMWFKWDGTTGVNTIFNNFTGSGVGKGVVMSVYQGNLAVWVGLDGSSWNIENENGGHSPTANNWHHAALTRQSNGDIELFLNGVKGTTLGNIGTSAIHDNNQPAHIGSSGGVFYFNGLIDDVRITKGLARYTTSFNNDPVITSPAVWPTNLPVAGATRPTRRWGGMTGRGTMTSGGGGDANWNYVTLLLDGSSETDVTGLSLINERGTVTSGYRTNAKFNHYTDFDNTTTQDNLKITLPSALGSSNEPFTIETWARFDVLGASGNEGVFQLTPSGTTIDGTTASGGVGGSSSLAMAVINNQWRVYNEATYVDNLGAVATNQWYHLAITSDGTTLRWFADGFQIHSIGIASTSVASGGYPNLVVGCYFTQYYGMNGRIEGFRVTKGVARYTSAFNNNSVITSPAVWPTSDGSATLQNTGVITLSEHYQSKL